MKTLRWFAFGLSIALLGMSSLYHRTWYYARGYSPPSVTKPARRLLPAAPISTAPAALPPKPLIPKQPSFVRPVHDVWEAKAPLQRSPRQVMTHIHSGDHLLLQDAKFVYLLDAVRGKLLWQRPLGYPIQSRIYTIDFYRNRKWQYLFSAGEYWYCIDYRGNRVARYPVPLPAQAEYFQCIDYAKNKRYRLGVVDAHGRFFLYDKMGHALPGWSPRALGSPCVAAPMHVRVAQKDYFITVHPTGQVQALTRKGNIYPGFPLQHAGEVCDAFIMRGDSPRDTFITLLLKTGGLAVYDFLGACVRTHVPENLPAASHLSCCRATNAADKCCLVARYAGGIMLYDTQGRLLLHRAHKAPEQLQVQYFNWSPGKTWYVVTDTMMECAVVFDGMLRQVAVLHSTAGVDMAAPTTAGEVHVYSAFNSKVVRYTLTTGVSVS